MKLLNNIVNWLTSSSARPTRKDGPDLHPIDVAKLTKELHLIEEARRLGEAGIPAPDAQKPAGPESEAIQRIENERQKYATWAVRRLGVINHDLAKRNVAQDINKARQADQEFDRKASTLLTEKDSMLRTLGETARKRQAELDDFKANHQLFREADYPTGAGAVLNVALLVLFVALEGGLNANFFAQGLDTGIIGGATQAMILAAINVSISYFFGKFPARYVYHVSAKWRTVGFVSLFVYFVVVCAIGLGIAHYRDALTEELVDPAKAALDAMLASPFNLRDFFSWMLFFVSLVFGVLSFYDGLKSDDSYPGYSSISKRTQLAIEDYEAELNKLRDSLEKLKDEELEFIEETATRTQTAVAVIASLIDDKKSAQTKLAAAIHDADNSLDALLHKFRTENEVHRKGLPRPAYFNAPPPIRPLNLPNFDTAEDETSLIEQRILVNALVEEMQDIRARIQAAFNQKFDRLKPLVTHFPGKES